MDAPTIAPQNLTPPEAARKFRVAEKKVLSWIRNGELAAFNVANRGSSRPRYVIPPESIEAFEQARTVVPQSSEGDR